MLKRHQKLLVTSAAVLGTFFGAGAGVGAGMAPAMASTHPTAVKPATSTNIDQGFEGETSCGVSGWHYCLFYSQNVTGAWWGSNQQSFGTIIATYPDDHNPGQGDPVRNDAASMADNSEDCNVTTWVDPNFTGAFNWLEPMWWGNLTSNLHNNEASISYNSCS